MRVRFSFALKPVEFSEYPQPIVQHVGPSDDLITGPSQKEGLRCLRVPIVLVLGIVKPDSESTAVRASDSVQGPSTVNSRYAVNLSVNPRRRADHFSQNGDSLRVGSNHAEVAVGEWQVDEISHLLPHVE
jgi:hypothetical protein